MASNAGDTELADLAGILTTQLQTMVRHGNYLKLTGVDITCSDLIGPQAELAVGGRLLYYAPTEGRVKAFQAAYKAVREGMKLQGINVHGNKMYDFRVSITDPALYNNNMFNQATIDGTNPLTLDSTAAATNDRVFAVYNSNIQPSQTAVVDFSAGFGLPGAPGAATDFILNPGELYEGSEVRHAHTGMEEIPFSVSFGSDSATGAASTTPWMWRPDPALYLAVMTGQILVVVDDINDSAGGTFVALECNFHVAGWKSIMGSKDKRRR